MSVEVVGGSVTVPVGSSVSTQRSCEDHNRLFLLERQGPYIQLRVVSDLIIRPPLYKSLIVCFNMHSHVLEVSSWLIFSASS